MTEIIKNVSDTSIWVAHYRALESERGDALFQDPYAKILVGDRAQQYDSIKSDATKWTQWTVVIRTYIIDQIMRDLIAHGFTTILNLGAGLDSRPYRMKFATKVQWVEVDFSHVIDYKKNALKDFKPGCQLTQVGLDLSNRGERQALFANMAKQHEKVVVLTEGVLPYLTENQVSELSEDLARHSCFKTWICEYLSPKSYSYLKNPKRMKALRNTPFQFFPNDWLGFFTMRGWHLDQEQYFTEVSEKVGRATPLPAVFKLIRKIMGPKWAQPFQRMSGFLVWSRSASVTSQSTAQSQDSTTFV